MGRGNGDRKGPAEVCDLEQFYRKTRRALTHVIFMSFGS